MKNDRWDLPSLVGALVSEPAAQAAGIEVTVPDDVGHAAVITVASAPGLSLVLGVDGGEIQVNVLLEKYETVGRNAEFNEHLLEASKMLPLSTFGITKVDGVKWYEIFGQMSSASGIDEVVEEITTLASNAVDALEMVVEWEGQASASGQQN